MKLAEMSRGESEEKTPEARCLTANSLLRFVFRLSAEVLSGFCWLMGGFLLRVWE